PHAAPATPRVLPGSEPAPHDAPRASPQRRRAIRPALPAPRPPAPPGPPAPRVGGDTRAVGAELPAILVARQQIEPQRLQALVRLSDLALGDLHAAADRVERPLRVIERRVRLVHAVGQLAQLARACQQRLLEWRLAASGDR